MLAAAVIIFIKYNAGREYTFKECAETVENPFQGAYFQWNAGDADGMYNVVREHPDYRVVLLTYNLDDESKTEIIPEEKTEKLSHALDVAEELELSVIFRAAYDFSGECIDPEFDIMLSHIRQMGEVLNAYKSCLMGVQAGMIGAFGEWTKSRYMDEKKYRMKVVKEWEEVLEEGIYISVRRQKFIREAEEWGLDTTRLGVYNDGLFSSDSDLGTYMEDYGRQEDLKWSETHIKVPFNGGEMPFVSKFSEIENVIKEARQLNLSYLNQEYNYEVWQYWAGQEYEGMPGDEYIKKHLGSRPWVRTLKMDRNIQRRSTVHVEVDMRNSGFAMLDERYRIYVVLRCGEKTVKKEADGDMESKEKGRFTASVENPFSKEEAEENGIEAGIQISREKEEEIKTSYCLRLANEGNRYEDGINFLTDISQEGNGK